MTTVGVGLWGLGNHARKNLLPAFRSCVDVELRGISTLEPDVLRKVSEEEGVTPYSNPDEMLGSPDIDAIYVAVPTGLHHDLGMRVLAAGKHLWCEKPLAATLEHREELLAAGDSMGLAVLECTMFSEHPQFQRVREIITSQQLGNIASVRARFGFPHLAPTDFRYQAALGGGALLDAGFYPLAAARLLLPGPLEVVGAKMVWEGSYEVDVRGAALLASNQGSHGLLEWGFGQAYRNEIEVWGESGSLIATRAFSKTATLETTIRLVMQSGEESEERIEPADHFANMLERFGQVVLDASWQELMAGAASQSSLVEAVRVASVGS